MSRSSIPGRRTRRTAVLATATAFALGVVPATAFAQAASDPRAGLAPATGNTATSPTINDNAAVAKRGVELAGKAPTPTWTTGVTPLSGSNLNSDLAFFDGDKAVMGNYQGFGIYDVSNAAAPELQTSVTCPGSQNDVSVHGDLLFLSVEQTTARIDCGAPVAGQSNAEVFRGVPMSKRSTYWAQRRRLNELGLRWTELAPLRDVDTFADARIVAHLDPGTRFAATLQALLDHAADDEQAVPEAAARGRLEIPNG